MSQVGFLIALLGIIAMIAAVPGLVWGMDLVTSGRLGFTGFFVGFVGSTLISAGEV